MKRLVIVGAGGFGREMCAAARESAVPGGGTFEVAGFLDADPAALDRFSGYPPILGAPETYVPCPDDIFITALGDTEARRRCAAVVAARGGEFATLVHRTASIGPNVALGPGSFVAAGASITVDVSIGAHVCIFHNSSIGHDARILDFAHVYAQCAIGGGVVIGEGARVYPGSVVAPRRKIGAGAVVGACSAVFADVRPGATVLGNPAMELK